MWLENSSVPASRGVCNGSVKEGHYSNCEFKKPFPQDAELCFVPLCLGVSPGLLVATLLLPQEPPQCPAWHSCCAQLLPGAPLGLTPVVQKIRVGKKASGLKRIWDL